MLWRSIQLFDTQGMYTNEVESSMSREKVSPFGHSCRTPIPCCWSIIWKVWVSSVSRLGRLDSNYCSAVAKWKDTCLNSSFVHMHPNILWCPQKWVVRRSILFCSTMNRRRFVTLPVRSWMLQLHAGKKFHFFCVLFPESRTSSLDALLRDYQNA